MLSVAGESSAQGPELKLPISTFGTPGLIDMPTGQVLSDGELISTLGYHQGNQRYTLTFQITPRLFGSFRYVIIDSLEFSGDTRYDRSFDLGYQLMKESRTLPSVVIGLRDFGGTGIYGSEFIAATKHFAQNRLSLTGGIGWGRLGSMVVSKTRCRFSQIGLTSATSHLGGSTGRARSTLVNGSTAPPPFLAALRIRSPPS